MKIKITVLYEICVCLAVLFLGYMFLQAKNDIYIEDLSGGYEVLKNHSYETKQDADAPLGFKQVYWLGPEEIPGNCNGLVFQTIHQNVEVFIDGTQVFHLRKNRESSVGKSPGCRLNTVPVSLENRGKEIRVEIAPVYASSVDIVPVFYAGARFSIYMDIVKDDIVSVLLSFLAVFLGIGFLVFSALNCRNPKFDKNLFLLGQFSLFLGIWKATDTGLAAMLAGHEAVVSYLPFIMLMLLVVPFTQYIRELFSGTDHWIWNISCFGGIVVFALSMGAQVLDIADLRETLWMNHLVMLLCISILFPMLYLEVHKVGWSNKLIAVAVSLCSCLIGFAADIILYYITDGAYLTDIGMIGFLIYIIIIGVMSLQDAKRLMSIGLKAEQLEKMAFHDQLTGMLNRAAYAEDTGRADFNSKDSVLVMFDLNDLKHCNDTYGHEKGDLYIKSGSALIRKVFGPFGKCYRMGGDEFCVLLKRKTEKECHDLIFRLKKEAEKWDLLNKETFSIQIAAGYAAYDSAMDYDIGDTLRRADKMMYMDKFAMKQERPA